MKEQMYDLLNVRVVKTLAYNKLELHNLEDDYKGTKIWQIFSDGSFKCNELYDDLNIAIDRFIDLRLRYKW